MSRIVLVVIVLLCFCSTRAKSANIAEIERQLIYADSLFSIQEYNNVINLLTPLEFTIQISDDCNLKLNYYLLLSASCLYSKDFVNCVQYMQKSSIYNNSDLEDLICAANISIIELGDYKEAKKYARKALIKYYGNPNYESNVNINRIGRLLYILGMSYIDSQDEFMAMECLKIHSALNIEEQNEIKEDLAGRIESINKPDSIISKKTCEFIRVNNSLDPKRQGNHNKQDSIQKVKAIKSCTTIKLDNLEYYLENVLSLDSIYEINQDVYSSKRLLDTAIQNINASNIRLSSSQGIKLMVRLGRIYSIFKDKDEALDWLFMAKNQCDETVNHDGIYVNILQLIANIYIERDIFWSRLFIEEAIEIYESINGSILGQNENSEAYSLLNSYAYILQKCSDYDIAENIYRHILKLCTDSNCIVFTLNNYGALLSELGRNIEAQYYYEQLNYLTPDIPCMTNLICAYINNEDYHKAEFIFKRYVESMIETTVNSWVKFTNHEIENWWDQSAKEFHMSSNYLANKINSNQSLTYGFNATIFCKIFPSLYNLVLKTCIEKSNNIIISDTNGAINHYKDELIKTKEINSDKPYLLHIKIRQLEDSLKTNIPDLFQRIMNEGVIYNDVINALDENEAAIEFFEYIDLLSDSISIQYAAYVVLPGVEAPIMIKLAPFQNTTDAIRKILLDETELNSLYSKSSSTMYDMIWDKLVPYVSDKKTIFYSTSGALSFINHDVIHDNNGFMLSDRFNLYRVSSTAQIPIVKRDTNADYETAFIYGNIDYDATIKSNTDTINNGSPIAIPKHIVISPEITRSGWANLTHTIYEIDRINAIMDSVGIKTKILENNRANEESFKNLDGASPDIIHLATHGFSAYKHKIYQSRSHISYTNYDQTLSSEGLLLSGANNIWLGKQIPPNIEDGILTAEEIANLDLRGTKLVVLSACETGKGSINMLGRIIGLQDAFKMAGVKSILMSLWQVPDESTAILMTEFYRALLSGKNRRESLKIAMSKTKEIYPDPYYWGAFVILD